MRPDLVSIVIPVYCNEESLFELFERLNRVTSGIKDCQFEFIFVDDGSTDGSLRVLKEISNSDERIRIVVLTRNFGAVRASKAGLKYVNGDAFIIMAADLQDPPELISSLVDAWRRGSKFVICARISRDDPITTRIFASIYYRIVRVFVVPGFPTGGFDLALMSRELLEPIRDSSKNVYTPILSFWLGYDPTVIQYHRPKRLHGKSKWTFGKKFNAFLDVFFGFSNRPLRAVTMGGAILALVAMLYAILVIIGKIAGRVDSIGFPTLVALVTFLSGVQLLTLGVVGEYLWRVLDNVDRRPSAVVDYVYSRSAM